jgi:hypothetical protein
MLEPGLLDPRMEPVEAWRLKQLIEAGYPIPIAERIAGRVDVDLHHAVELVTSRGCAPDLAGEILL